METPVIPNPPLVRNPAALPVRTRWIGRLVRMGRRHLKEPDPNDPEFEQIISRQAEYRDRGVGQVLDVGISSWFLVRWSNGQENQEWKKDLDIVDAP